MSSIANCHPALFKTKMAKPKYLIRMQQFSFFIGCVQAFAARISEAAEGNKLEIIAPRRRSQLCKGLQCNCRLPPVLGRPRCLLRSLLGLQSSLHMRNLALAMLTMTWRLVSSELWSGLLRHEAAARPQVT